MFGEKLNNLEEKQPLHPSKTIAGNIFQDSWACLKNNCCTIVGVLEADCARSPVNQ
jgi:hypothetical protein